MAQSDTGNPFQDEVTKRVDPKKANPLAPGYTGDTGIVGPRGASSYPDPGIPGKSYGDISSLAYAPGSANTAPARDGMPSGMDPALAAIYQGSGLSPSGRGSGFADWQYWQDVGLSQYGRLKADIAGTGSDQPTGTPGQGAWSSSGRNASGGGSSGGFSAGGSALDPTRSNALYDLLMKRAGTSLDVNPNDPIIKGQTDAYGAQVTNAAKNYESAQAERGGEQQNPEAIRRSMAEQGGQAQGAFQAQLMGNELTARRAEIENALSGAAGLLTSEQQLALQEELAKLQLAQQESQFGRDLGQRGYEFGQNNIFRNSPLYGGG